MRGKVVGLLVALLSSGCASKEHGCAFLAPGYARLDENLAKLPAIPSTTLPIDARQTVERCYPAHPYLDYSGPFRFVAAKTAKNGNIYLVYEPIGITDVQLVFALGRNLRPLKAFQYSTL